MKTGNTTGRKEPQMTAETPQWSPVMKTGNTLTRLHHHRPGSKPQWSPVMKTGNTGRYALCLVTHTGASMEPGHEDREYQLKAGRHRPDERRLNGARS